MSESSGLLTKRAMATAPIIADSITKALPKRIVEPPARARPSRIVVGQAFGADDINAKTAPIQAQLLEGLGLGLLAEPRRIAASA